MIHQLTLSAFAMLVLAVFGTALSLGVGPLDLAPVVRVLLVVITFILLRDYARRVCFASFQMKTALLLDSCVAVCQIGGLLLLAYLDLLSANLAFWVIGSACGIPALSWLVWARKAFALRISQVISDLSCNWSLGKWIFAGNIMFLMITELHRWFLTSFHDTAATGVFSACLGVVLLVNPLVLGLVNFLNPKTSHAFAFGREKEVKPIVLRMTLIFAAIAGSLCLSIFFFGDRLLVLIYGSKYAGNGHVMMVLALAESAWILTIPFHIGLWAIERPDVNFKINLIGVTACLIFSPWIVRALGPLGAAYGLLIAMTVTSCCKWIAFAIISHSLTGSQSNWVGGRLH